MTAHDLLLDRILAALADAPALAKGQVHEDLGLGEVPPEAEAAVVVRLARSQEDRPYAGSEAPEQYTTSLQVTSFVRDGRRTSQGRPAYALADLVHQRLAAAGTFGDLLLQPLTRTLLQPNRELAETRMAALDALYVAVHHSPWNTTAA